MSNDVSTVLLREGASSKASTSSLSSPGWRGFTWPAIAMLAIIPTSNVQLPNSFVLANETCVRSTRRRDGYVFEIYTDWYVPSWEEIAVPKLPTVGHIKGNLQFQGALKWRPYVP